MTETRSKPMGLEVRNEGDDGPATISGYGAVFYREDDPGTQYELWDGAVERIMPGAFKEALGGDVRSLFNHDSNFVLGRTSAGTSELREDESGLHYQATPPDTQSVRDLVLEPISRGDVDGSSFMFRVKDEEWTEEERADDDETMLSVRNIKSVELFEAGPVTFPAYQATSADSRTEARASFTKWTEERKALEEVAREQEHQKIKDDLDMKMRESILAGMH